MKAHFQSGADQPGGTWSSALRILQADGTPREFEATATNLLDRPAVRGVVVTLRDVTERNAQDRQLRELAFLDGLTGLPNWARLRTELERLLDPAESEANQFALLLLDVDNFREVNDSLSHQSGDALLQQIGKRLAAELHEQDVLARLGGDEFAALFVGVDAKQAHVRGEQLLAAVERPFEINGSLIQLGASAGIVVCPEHGADADLLRRRADVAMYAAKDSRAGCILYAPDQDRHTPERLALIHDLRRAIDQAELVLQYQPQIDVRSGVLSGVEALVRWAHPVRRLISPEEFIPLAVDSRLIQPLSRLVLRVAVEQCAVWREAELVMPVSVNLSAYDLSDPALPDYVAELLARNEVPPQSLRVEITESSLMLDPLRSRDVLSRLRAQGIQIAIDDFGTGYSSLGYLKNLPVDELKIDKSFVQDMAVDAGARAIVRAVIDLADDLGLRVVAEGIEDRATWEALAALGCDLAQGYYFSPPLAGGDLLEWSNTTRYRLEHDQARLAEAALTRRVRERGARLTAEEEFIARKRAEAALRESEERLRLALEAADIATWDWDLVHQTITWSGGAASFCASQSDLDGSRDSFLACVHPEDRAMVETEANAAIATTGELQVEHRFMRRDGSIRWLARKGRVIRDPAGRPVRLLGVDVDISERKLAEHQREGLARTEKLRALGQMASGVAHDLNQSLTLIAGFSALAGRALEGPAVDSSSAREALATVTRAAIDGGQTVKRLLTFARNQPDTTRGEVNAENLLREVAQLTSPRWRDAAQGEGRPISLHVEGSGDTTILGSASSLREAITNLVFNAVDALPAGGTIILGARSHPDRVVVTVTDSGTGMSPEVQAHIFEPFFTTKGSTGTGMGLAQVFGIVEQHNGRVEVDSTPGVGTAFRLVFPAASASVANSSTGHLEQRGRPRRLKILAVDDEPLIGSLVSRILRPDGHVVITATSGEEALERLRREVVDLVISDVGMGPGMNGWDLAAQARQQQPELRFVLATGWGAQIDLAEARLRGVDAVIAKPYSPDDLYELIATVCQSVSGSSEPRLAA